MQLPGVAEYVQAWPTDIGDPTVSVPRFEKLGLAAQELAGVEGPEENPEAGQSTRAPVKLADEGFRTSPETAQEETWADVGNGKFPTTETALVADDVPATWKKDAERPFPPARAESAES